MSTSPKCMYPCGCCFRFWGGLALLVHGVGAWAIPGLFMQPSMHCGMAFLVVHGVLCGLDWHLELASLEVALLMAVALLSALTPTPRSPSCRCRWRRWMRKQISVMVATLVALELASLKFAVQMAMAPLSRKHRLR